MPKMATPVGPVLGSLRSMRKDGKPPGGGASWRMGMSLTDCEFTVWVAVSAWNGHATPLVANTPEWAYLEPGDTPLQCFRHPGDHPVSGVYVQAIDVHHKK